MSATDRAITLACFLKFEAPGGDVRLCDGGMLEYDGEVYTAHDSVFGSILNVSEITTLFADMAEDLTITFAPNPGAAVSDWWRTDLYDCRARVWQGELDSDGYTVSNATLETDLLVDRVDRLRGPNGQETLTLHMVGRAEKLFLINEGNVCSERFHKTVYSGEDGFNNCTDIVGYVAWGIAGATAGTTVRGGFGLTPSNARGFVER